MSVCGEKYMDKLIQMQEQIVKYDTKPYIIIKADKDE